MKITHFLYNKLIDNGISKLISSLCSNSSGLFRTLDIPVFWICLWFWIYEIAEYARIRQCPDMPEYTWIDYVWLRLNTSERALICQNMLNIGQNEVKKFGERRFKKNQTLSTRACMNQRDNAKLKSSDNKKAQFTIFRNK